jgi:hypothetical protein
MDISIADVRDKFFKLRTEVPEAMLRFGEKYIEAQSLRSLSQHMEVIHAVCLVIQRLVQFHQLHKG